MIKGVGNVEASLRWVLLVSAIAFSAPSLAQDKVRLIGSGASFPFPTWFAAPTAAGRRSYSQTIWRRSARVKKGTGRRKHGELARERQDRRHTQERRGDGDDQADQRLGRLLREARQGRQRAAPEPRVSTPRPAAMVASRRSLRRNFRPTCPAALGPEGPKLYPITTFTWMAFYTRYAARSRLGRYAHAGDPQSPLCRPRCRVSSPASCSLLGVLQVRPRRCCSRRSSRATGCCRTAAPTSWSPRAVQETARVRHRSARRRLARRGPRRARPRLSRRHRRSARRELDRTWYSPQWTICFAHARCRRRRLNRSAPRAQRAGCALASPDFAGGGRDREARERSARDTIAAIELSATRLPPGRTCQKKAARESQAATHALEAVQGGRQPLPFSHSYVSSMGTGKRSRVV